MSGDVLPCSSPLSALGSWCPCSFRATRCRRSSPACFTAHQTSSRPSGRPARLPELHKAMDVYYLHRLPPTMRNWRCSLRSGGEPYFYRSGYRVPAAPAPRSFLSSPLPIFFPPGRPLSPFSLPPCAPPLWGQPAGPRPHPPKPWPPPPLGFRPPAPPALPRLLPDRPELRRPRRRHHDLLPGADQPDHDAARPLPTNPGDARHGRTRRGCWLAAALEAASSSEISNSRLSTAMNAAVTRLHLLGIRVVQHLVRAGGGDLPAEPVAVLDPAARTGHPTVLERFPESVDLVLALAPDGETRLDSLGVKRCRRR